MKKAMNVVGLAVLLCAGTSALATPSAPKCALIGTGSFNSSVYNFRLAIDDTVVVGRDYLVDAIESLKDARAQGFCEDAPQGTCSLSGPGTYDNLNYNYIISIGSEVVSAKDAKGDALNVMALLRAEKICR